MIGKASGEVLLEEASKAVYGVYLTLKKAKRKDTTDEELMMFILAEVGKNIAHMESHYIGKLEGKPDDPEDFINKVFGDLFKEGDKP